ncbi:MAG: class I SAM-dependent methyltransferase [Thermoplasmata archaeon]|nr:class I SAM-dependent methyltransferase [Thermoplasmata archaeon]
MAANLRAWTSIVRAKGVWRSLGLAIDRTIGSRPLPWFSKYDGCFRGARALEIGGPSWVFSSRGFAPVYPLVGRLDSVDFSKSTLWSRPVFPLSRKFGSPIRQGDHYVEEATDLHSLANETYDCLLASHVLEHVANPVRALLEWKRITRSGGVALVIVPEKSRSFDHRRPSTSAAHMISDLTNQVTEDDTTHLPEILALHDLRLDPAAGSREDFVRRSTENRIHRGMHHHVFDVTSLESLARFAGLNVLEKETRDSHIVILLRKPTSDSEQVPPRA